MVGRVKWFNNIKGYGFIDYTSDADIFVHYSVIKQTGYKTLSENDVVDFELIETPKGFQAVNVSHITNPNNNNNFQITSIS